MSSSRILNLRQAKPSRGIHEFQFGLFSCADSTTNPESEEEIQEHILNGEGQRIRVADRRLSNKRKRHHHQHHVHI